MRRLNIGCGNKRMAGWIGIDQVATSATDIVRDLKRGLPFEDSSVDEILCDNVLEHIGPPEDFIFVLNEMFRVLKPGAVCTIIVPHAGSQAAWQDPTHVRAFVPRSALYWNQDLQWAKLYGITADFDVNIWVEGDMETEAFIRFICTAREKPPACTCANPDEVCPVHVIYIGSIRIPSETTALENLKVNPGEASPERTENSSKAVQCIPGTESQPSISSFGDSGICDLRTMLSGAGAASGSLEDRKPCPESSIILPVGATL
jgi:hypothetical protein